MDDDGKAAAKVVAIRSTTPAWQIATWFSLQHAKFLITPQQSLCKATSPG